ncbi:MAG: gliding motility lipoprotein GldH [Prevotellaceae bacterium]|nr:gliding motility lipoprotein GldH [Prevotellaceae bacterium]
MATIISKSKIFIAGIILAIFLNSCDPARVYEQYRSFPIEGWVKDSAATFSVKISDTLTMNNVYINLRNTSAYPFSNIFMFVKATAPDSAYTIDTVEYTLADEFGRWTGKGFSKILDNRLIFRKQVIFPRGGIYTFEIQQGMRNEVLPHITDVGLRIEKVE